MSDIPSELYREILVRSPAESLFRFKRVCKEWLQIIEDPSFIRAHTNNQLYSHTLLLRNGSRPTLYSFSLDSLNFIKGPQMIDATRIKRLIDPSMPHVEQDLFYVASCNGLILVPQWGIKQVWRIWNPLTGESHELPQPSADFSLDPLVYGFGFGYDGDADDYKVVRIDTLFPSGKNGFQTLVYSLKSHSWSMIEGYPCNPVESRGTFWNGALYWPSRDGVIALHLGTETYSQLPLPPAVNLVESFGFHFLDALDGCLIFSKYYFTTGSFDGWVMKDNGVEKWWIKLFSLQYYISWRSRLVAYLSRKEQIVVQIDSGFLWFDIGNNSALKFSIHGIPNIHSSRICPGSLVRLNVHSW